MARHLGRPAPELTWLVVCTIRPPLLSPSDPELTYDVMESSWEDGILRVMQLSIARLAFSFTSSFEGTIFQCYGRRNALDRPVLFSAPYVLDGQHQHMEGQLHNTQIALDFM